MILLDALYINNSGGKVLLDYLIEELEQTEFEIFYLLDRRVENKHPKIKLSNTVLYLEASIIKRHRFYLANRKKFKKVFCFGNLPPTIRLTAEVYIYFHQKLFISIKGNYGIKVKVLFRLKAFFLKTILKNADYWIVQTRMMRDDFLSSFANVKCKSVLVIPFYPSLFNESISDLKTTKGRFIYVSNGLPHKNHQRLIEAFALFYKKCKTGELHLTISNDFTELTSQVAKLREAGIPIVNHGLVERESLLDLYSSSEFCIYPSLTESFGLGIIEAIEGGCKLIGPDLPYIYCLCYPSLVFKAEDVTSIQCCFETAVTSYIKPSQQLVFNEIKKLIALLK